jgi:hypothetical protein
VAPIPGDELRAFGAEILDACLPTTTWGRSMSANAMITDIAV